MKKSFLFIIFLFFIFQSCHEKSSEYEKINIETKSQYDLLVKENGEKKFLNKHFSLYNYKDSLFILSPDDYTIYVTNEEFEIYREINFKDKDYMFPRPIRGFTICSNGDIIMWDSWNIIRRMTKNAGSINNIEIDKSILEAYSISNICELSNNRYVISFAALSMTQYKDSVSIGAIVDENGNKLKIIKTEKQNFSHNFDFIEWCFVSLFKDKIIFYFKTNNLILSYSYSGLYLKKYFFELNEKLYLEPRLRKNDPRKGIDYFSVNSSFLQIINNKLHYLKNNYPNNPEIYIYNSNMEIEKVFSLNLNGFYPNNILNIKDKYISYFSNQPIFGLTNSVKK